jgi:hypothetical protein
MVLAEVTRPTRRPTVSGDPRRQVALIVMLTVQQATRHGWRNKGGHPATIASFMLGSGR